MSCSGNLILIGDPVDRVLALCGPPTNARDTVYAKHRSEVVLQVWRYERSGWLDRVLFFVNGRLASIQAVGPLRMR